MIETKEIELWRLISYYIWVLIAFFCSLIMYAQLLCSITLKKLDAFARKANVGSIRGPTLNKVKYYPLALIICYSFGTVRRIIEFSDSKAPTFVKYGHVITSCLWGFLNALIFFWPLISQWLQTFQCVQDLIECYVECRDYVKLQCCSCVINNRSIAIDSAQIQKQPQPQCVYVTPSQHPLRGINGAINDVDSLVTPQSQSYLYPPVCVPFSNDNFGPCNPLKVNVVVDVANTSIASFGSPNYNYNCHGCSCSSCNYSRQNANFHYCKTNINQNSNGHNIHSHQSTSVECFIHV